MSEHEGYEDTDAIRARVNIVEVAQAYTELKLAPHGEWRGLCPIHEERTPSFDVNEEKQLFTCRGCGEGGDVFRLVELVEGKTFLQAKDALAAMNGSGYTPPAELPKRAKAQRPEGPKAPKEYDRRELEERGHDLSYLDREFSVKRCRTDALGVFWQYPTMDENHVLTRARQKFRDPDKSGKKYRWLPGDKNEEPCGYPLWKLSGVADVWLVNGEPSVWLCWEEGIEAVCTLSETSYSRLPELMALLKELGTKTLHVLLDNDAAGRRGTVKAVQAARDAKLDVKAYKWYPGGTFKPGYDVADLHQDERRDKDIPFIESLAAQAEATDADLEAWANGDEPPPEVTDETGGEESVEQPARGNPEPKPKPKLVDVNQLPQFRKCPDCGHEAIKRSKAANDGGWFCDRGQGGCGVSFPAEDERITSQKVRAGRPLGSKNTGSVEAQVEAIKEQLDECPLLRSYTGQGFIEVEDEYGPLDIPVDYEAFQDHVVLLGEALGMTLKADTIKSVRNSIGARARRNGVETEFYLRIGAGSDELRDRIYLDLSNRQRQVVEIGEDVPGGWRVLDRAPHGVHFWRPAQQGALPVPVGVQSESERAELWVRLEQFLQPGTTENFVKMVAWMLQCLRPPRGPYMGMCMTGRAGSGKTQRCRMLARIVNSPKATLRRASEDPRNFHASVNSNFVLGFENLSNIPQWMSDDLCQIATGASIELRKMRTNLELETIDARRPIIVNGITDFMKQSDLKRRFLFVELQPVPAGLKKGEPELFAEFYEYLPRFLGLMLDCVAASLRHGHDPELFAIEWGEGDPDFGRWIAAAERGGVLPWNEGVFAQVYLENILSAAKATLSDSMLAQAVWLMMDAAERRLPEEKRGGVVEVRGMANQIYNRLTHYAMLTMIDEDTTRDLLAKNFTADQLEGLDIIGLWDLLDSHQQNDIETRTRRQMEKSNQWPAMPATLSRWMQNDANQLEILGIKFDRDAGRTAKGREWTITRRPLIGDAEDVFED